MRFPIRAQYRYIDIEMKVPYNNTLMCAKEGYEGCKGVIEIVWLALHSVKFLLFESRTKTGAENSVSEGKGGH